MVFSSVPLYLDPPNWNQGSADAVTIDDDNDIHQLQQAIPQQAAGGGGARLGGSMAERARLAKIPQPEAALKCPRCDSTNTKFCYFNNYSLTQPRHFCKTCRRYWTRGGALRSVPVGGGCRRNKRTAKPSSSSKQSMVPAASSNGPHLFPSAPLPFAAPWHHIHDYGFGGIQHPIDMPESGGLEQWRIHQVQQPPFLGGLAPEASVPMTMVSGLYQFEGDGKILSTVKVEENTQAASSSAACLPKQFFTMGRDEGQIWPSVGGGEHVTGFSSSAGHLL